MVRRVTKRKVTKRRKKKQSLKAQLGGGEKHYCLYSTLDSEGNHVDGCPNYYFKPLLVFLLFLFLTRLVFLDTLVLLPLTSSFAFL